MTGLMPPGRPAPEWATSEWFNTSAPLRLAGLRGKVVVLHTVFEHHEAMTSVALRAFIHEYRLNFPIGVDLPSGNPGDPVPATMRAYGTRGTPSLVLIDRNGFLRRHGFGAEDDLAVGAAIATLATEA